MILQGENPLEEIKAIVEGNLFAHGIGLIDGAGTEEQGRKIPTQVEFWKADYKNDPVSPQLFGIRDFRDAVAVAIYDTLFDTSGDEDKVTDPDSPDEDVGQGRRPGFGNIKLELPPGGQIEFKVADNNILIDEEAIYINGQAWGGPGFGGEINTAINIGTAGVGIFKEKLGPILLLKKIYSTTAALTIEDNVSNDQIDLTIVPEEISHQDLGGAGTHDHTSIDSHIGNSTIHSALNDGTTSATSLWSSSRISSELSGKADATHDHPASEITDFDTEVSSNSSVAANSLKVSASDWVIQASLTGTQDGINTVFTTPANFLATKLMVYNHGQRLKRGHDYNETGSNQVTFTTPPISTDDFIIDYLPS